MKMKSSMFALLVLVFVLSACGNQPTLATTATTTAVPAGTVITEGHIRPSQSVNLAFQGRGAVTEILVKIGDHVKQGDVLMRISGSDQAQAALVSAQQAYDLLVRDAAGGRASAWQAYMAAQKVRADALNKWDNLDVNDIERRMRNQQQVVDDRQKTLDTAQATFDKVKDMPATSYARTSAVNKLQSAQENLDGAIRQLESITRERDTVRAALDAAIAAEAEAKYQYDLTANGPNADQLALAKAQVAAAQDALDNFELKAPFDSVVADVSVDTGQQVGPETVAVSVADPSQWIVETNDLTELEVVKLAEGQKVTMIPDALPDVKLTGTIQTISGAFTRQGGDIVYNVRILVDNPIDPRIRWGMTVEATFAPPQK